MIDAPTAKQVVSANIRKCLDARGWSISRLVELMDEPTNTVYRVCRGDNEPRAALLANIAEALGVTVDNLLDENFSISAKKFRRRD